MSFNFGCRRCEIERGLVRGCNPPFVDTGSLDDPLVRRVHFLGQLAVGGVDEHAGDVAGVLEAEVLPRLAGVGRAVEAGAEEGVAVGVGLAGAGVSTENLIASNIKAFIEGSGVTGIAADSILLSADDTSLINVDAAAASIVLFLLLLVKG